MEALASVAVRLERDDPPGWTDQLRREQAEISVVRTRVHERIARAQPAGEEGRESGLKRMAVKEK